MATPHEFVEAWQTSDTVAQAAEKIGCTKLAARVRAFRYRQQGVNLKVFAPVEIPRVDWEQLADFADSLVENGDDSE